MNLFSNLEISRLYFADLPIRIAHLRVREVDDFARRLESDEVLRIHAANPMDLNADANWQRATGIQIIEILAHESLGYQRRG